MQGFTTVTIDKQESPRPRREVSLFRETKRDSKKSTRTISNGVKDAKMQS